MIHFKDFDLQKRSLNELQQEHNQLKEILASREKLIQVKFLILNSNFYRKKKRSILGIRNAIVNW